VQAMVDRIVECIEQARELYHRLVLVICPSEDGKVAIIEEVRHCTGAPLLNVNLEISRLMLDLTERQRSLQLPRLLDELISDTEGDLVLLKNFELFFDVSLKMDPLRLIERISRNRTVVAFWNGAIEEGYLTYATPEHPEYRRYLIQNLLIVNATG
jgi:hypothetical protein